MREDEIEKKEKKKNVHIHARIHTDRRTQADGNSPIKMDK